MSAQLLGLIGRLKRVVPHALFPSVVPQKSAGSSLIRRLSSHRSKLPLADFPDLTISLYFQSGDGFRAGHCALRFDLSADF